MAMASLGGRRMGFVYGVNSSNHSCGLIYGSVYLDHGQLTEKHDPEIVKVDKSY